MEIKTVTHYPHERESHLGTLPDIHIIYDDGSKATLFNDMLIGAWLWVQRDVPVPEDIAQEIRDIVTITQEILPGQIQEKMHHWEPKRQTLFQEVFDALGITLEE